MSTAAETSNSASLQAKRAKLAARLAQGSAQLPAARLSFGQERLWFLEQLHPGSVLYNVPVQVRFIGELALGALERAFDALIARHESLRTRFVCVDGTALQFIGPRSSFKLQVTDLSNHPQAQAEAAERVREEANQPFDLGSNEPLLRVRVMRLRSDEHLLVLTLHHIIADEWSLKVLFRELAFHYERALGGEPALLPDLPIQYPDYAVWQRNWLKGNTFDQLLGYWKQQLSGNPPVLELLPDHPRPATPTFQGTQAVRSLAQNLSEELKSLASRKGVTVFMLLLAGFKALLHRYTGQEDVVVGSPIAGRNRVETENLIGFFVNTLVLRTSAAGDPSFEEFLARVRKVTLEAYEHQDLPFEKLVEHLQPERSLAHLPFTKVMFLVQNELLEEMQWPDLRLQFEEIKTDTSKFELTLVAQETRRGLVLRAEYNTRIFETATIDRLLCHFELLLEGLVRDPAQRLSQLPLLSPAERHQLVVEWNNTRTEYPHDKCIHQVFEEQAARAPKATAVVFGEQELTYGELNSRANQLARFLQHLKVGPGVPVGLAVGRSRDMVLGMLAILKAGGAYVPLDPGYPRERLAFMLADTGAPVVLTQQELVAQLPQQTGKVISLDTDWELIGCQTRENLPCAATPDSLAYIMYTSGSTGQPKGVAVPHRAVNRLVLNTDYIRFDASDRVAQLSNVSFDAATFEIWGALLNGGQLIGIPQEVMLSARSFGREVQARGITAMFLTAAVFNQLASEEPASLHTVRTVIAGGEALDPKWVRAVLEEQPPQRLVNGYGPTENTTFTCCGLIRELAPGATHVSIGRPIANSQVYILDQYLNPVPIGVPGELYAGGDGLARGYWNRPRLTAEKFVANPFGPPGSLLYKTGDLARYLSDGTIEFLGRIDQQVKLRGYRIELGEIENALSRHPGVRSCVVTLDGSGARTKRLVAYIVPSAQAPPNTSELRVYLGELLPDFMIPAVFVPLAKFPLTANGKVDRRALPAPERARPELEKQYSAPRNAEEEQLVSIWENVLGVRPIGVEDKFFELGGHSLLAVKLVGQIERAFGKKLRLSTIFQAPTIAQLAAILREEAGEDQSTSLVEIQPEGTETPLFLVHGAGGGMFWGYVNLSRQLGHQQPVYGFKSRGLDGAEEFQSIEEMAAHYVANLQRVQPRGPYHLGGYCFGGVVAYEMARQLAHQNEQVGLLALFNCAPPNSRYTRIPWTPRWFFRLLRNLVYWVGYAWSWTPSQRREFIRWKWNLLKGRLNKWRLRLPSQATALEAGELVDLSAFTRDERKVWEAHIRALMKYQPRAFPGRVHLFRTSGHALWCSFDPDYGWGELAKGGVEVTIVPGAHEKILKEPCVGILADRLQEALSKVHRAQCSKASCSSAALAVAAREGEREPAIGGKPGFGLKPENTASQTTLTRGSEPASPFVAPAVLISGPTVKFAIECTYAQQFSAQVMRTPHACAVRTSREQLTYAELDTRANRWAHYLQSQGVGPEVLVGVCLQRSVDLMVALLAVLKAGGAYLPLDPTYPPERLRYMLRDSKARLVLSSRTAGAELIAPEITKVLLDDAGLQAEVESFPSMTPAVIGNGDSLAYVIYTSGSTGEPKGVEITHRALLNHNFAVARIYQLGPSERVLQFTPISFDISAEEIFPTWLTGGAVVLRSADRSCAPEQFIEFAAGERLTVLNIPTAYWHELTEYLHSSGRGLPDCVRLVVIGGEPASQADWNRWRECVSPKVRLLNAYGTTETAITSTVFAATPDSESLPIGRPLANVYAMLLDASGQPVQAEAPGELYIGGAGLARGYRYRPALTTERFISGPSTGPANCQRWYRTGDLARLRPDGNLEFLGRVDEQVKVRGYRIELGEIEAALLSHPEVKSAAVIAREDSPGSKRLVAYIVPRETPGPRSHELAGFLKSKLPDYMLPTAFVPMTSLPLTPAGKVDRRALPAPGNTRPPLEAEFTAPQTPLQIQTARIWSEVLGVQPIGLHDNFFELGGHSLVAIQVIARLREQLRVEVSLAEFFAHPTVAELANLLSEMTSQLPVRDTDANRGAAGRSGLSARQRRLWLLEQFHLTCSPFNRPVALRLTGPLRVDALRKALTALAARHQALRSVFPRTSGEPQQCIYNPEEVALPVLEFDRMPEPERQETIRARLVREARRPYVLEQRVLRPLLVRIAPQEHCLLIVLHEIAVDFRSTCLLVSELVQHYENQVGRGGDKGPILFEAEEVVETQPAPPGELEEDWRYWQRQLAGAPDSLDLPADRARPTLQTGEGARVPCCISGEILQAVEKLAQEQGCSVFSVLLAAFATVLHRYTEQPELVIGSVVGSESRTTASATVSNLENPVALRCRLEGDPQFLELLQRFERVWAEANAHSRLPFADLVERLDPERKTNYTRIFQTSFQFLSDPCPVLSGGGVSFTPFELDNQTAKLELSLVLSKSASGLSGWFEYSTDLFEAARIKRLAGHFVHLLAHAVVAPETRLSALPLLTRAETSQLLVEWNQTERVYPKDKSIGAMFLEQADRTPQAEALICGDRRVSYRELREQALGFAGRLTKLGVGPEKLVGICLERSVEMIVSMLGTLLAGGAYVPLDPAYPAERLAFIMDDAHLQVLITQRKFLNRIQRPNAEVVLLDDLAREPYEPSGSQSPGPIHAAPSSLAYIIYTSGSTGRPKGVALEHRNAVAFISWARSVFSAEELSGVLASTSICFDLSVFEIFVPLAWGGRVILAENALALTSLPTSAEVSLVNTVPSAIRELLRLKAVPPSVRVINLAGEPLSPALVDQIYAQTAVEKVFDLYGPSETTTYSTFSLRRPGEPATIGRPLANEQVYVLDPHLQPVPIGVAGELYIGGEGVARGYLNRPELTAERFIANPFKPAGRIYRTGDLVRWRADGNLEYIGRRDQQVKIRGFRVELGEIESILKAQRGVADTVVVARQEQGEDKRLAGYIVAEGTSAPTAEVLRNALRAQVPEYMVPADFVFLDKLPLTPNGKIDRKALPAPERERHLPEQVVEAPRTAHEEQLLAIWRQVLSLEHIGIKDNFFDLGGHSLLATQLISRMREIFRVELPLGAFFAAPTIEALAAGLDGGAWLMEGGSPAPGRVSREKPHPLSFVQERLWFLDQLEPGSHAYHVPIALRLEGELHLEALRRALQHLITRHEALRTTFVYVDGRLTQVIAPELALPLEVQDFSQLPAEERAARSREWLGALAQRSFALARGPLVRAGLLGLGPHEHILIVVLHHVISDGWSLSILFQELSVLYSAFASGGSAPALPELPLQYIDFAHWQRQTLQGPVLQAGIDYWKEKLAGAPVTIELPTDHESTGKSDGRASRCTLLLNSELTQLFARAGHTQHATPFMLLMSALAITLYKWCEQRDLIIGTVVAGRTRREFENVFGCFMNFLPIRTRLRSGMTGAQTLTQVAATVLEAQAHQDCPFEKMVEAVNPERRLNQNPLYNVALLVQNFPAEPFQTKTLHATPVPVPMEAALLDLRFEAERTAEGFSVSCEYRKDLFAQETVEQLLSSLADSLKLLLTQPDAKLADYCFDDGLVQQRKRSRSRAERQTVAVAATFTAEPLSEPLAFWLKELELPATVEFAPYNQVFQQLLTPGSVLTGNTRGLNVLLLRLEDWEQRGNAEELTGAADSAPTLRRNVEDFCAALKGALHGGVSYLVCLCPASGTVLADPARAQILAGEEAALLGRLREYPGVYVLTHAELKNWYPVADYNDASSDELGHVPYTPVFFSALATGIARKLHALNRVPCKVLVLDCDNTLWSGVCGEDGPKGVGLETCRLALQQFALAQKEQGKLLCLCSKNNEEDVWQVFEQNPHMPLRREHFAAWRLNWQPKSENLKTLARELGLGLDSFVLLDDNPVECAEVEANCPEVLALELPQDPALLPTFLAHCWVFDQLKVTEADRSRSELYHQQQQREQLRASASNLADFIAGLELNVEIGPMVSTQVERVAQLTQRTNQFNTTTLRRSEAELSQLAGTADVWVVQVKDRFGDYGLVGAMVCRHSDKSLNIDSLLLSCRVLGRGIEHRMLARLGEVARGRGADWVDIHFVPSAKNKPVLDFLESIGRQFKQPLNGGYVFRFPAGFAADAAFCPPSAPVELAPEPKMSARTEVVNATEVQKFRRCRQLALEANSAEAIHRRIEARRTFRVEARHSYAPPRSDSERRLCELWQELLRVERVGVHDDFFELGGHSLLAVRLFAEVEKRFGRKLPLVTIFQAPTVEQLANVLSRQEGNTYSLLVPVQPRGDRPPLFLVHGAGGDVLWGYANLANYLPADQPVYGIKSRGQAGLDEPTNLEEMAARYLEAVREFQPNGPYYLGGYCFGGNVAYEMARQLQSDGQRVALIALLDTAPSNAGYERMTWWRPNFLMRFAHNFSYWWQDFAALKPAERRNFVTRKLRALARKAARRVRGRAGAELVDVEEVIDPTHFPANELKLWRLHLQALAVHVEQPYIGKVTLLRTRGQPLFCSLEEDFCWSQLALGGVLVKWIPGSHENIFLEPNVRSLASALADALTQAQSETTHVAIS